MSKFGKWEGISSAPKESGPILLAWRAVVMPNQPARWFQTVGYWDDDFTMECINDDGDYAPRGAWTDGVVASWSYEEIRELHPSHWMPLPNNPEAA